MTTFSRSNDNSNRVTPEAGGAVVPGRVEPHLPANLPSDFDGLARPDSVTWRVNGEVILLAGWGRAILLQLAHPLVAAGVADHSSFRAGRLTRLIRLQHTLGSMLDLTFGTTDQAMRAARRIDAIHEYVTGTLAEDVGNLSAGTPYFARDPHLLRWVHATLVDSFLLTYRLFVGPLSPTQEDEFCAESVAIGPLLGVPEGFLPTTRRDNRAYMHEMLASGRIQVGSTARMLAGHLLTSPLPVVGRPLAGLLKLPIAGLLPEPIRSDYGLPWDRRRETSLILAASVSRALLRRLPDRLHRWPAARRGVKRPGQMQTQNT